CPAIDNCIPRIKEPPRKPWRLVERFSRPALADRLHERNHLVGHHASVPLDRIEAKQVPGGCNIEWNHAPIEPESRRFDIHVRAEIEHPMIQVPMWVDEAQPLTLHDQRLHHSFEEIALADIRGTHDVHVRPEVLRRNEYRKLSR